MEKGQILELNIEDMSREGQGIGKAEGFAVFVADTVPGDRVKVELTKVKKNYGFGKVLEILEESEDRIEEFCPYLKECGGCPYGKIGYEAQLRLKEKQVKDKLIRLGGLKDPVIHPIIAAEEPFRYRNKASMAVSTGGLITRKGGVQEPIHEPRVGFFKEKSHEVVDCKDCALQSEPAMAAADALRRFMEEDHITSYDPRWEKGLMRHMVVRTAEGTGQVMVILVVNGKAIPNSQKLVEMLDEAIFNVPVYSEGPLAGVEFNLTSVVLNINKKNTSEIFGKECITIAGKDTILEKVGGLEFEISPLSFYQVNRSQMVKLYDKALEYAAIKDGDTVLDLYCGVGTIGLFAAKYADCRVIGIESVKAAVLDANRNATINGIVNARYFCGKAEEELPFMMGMKKLYKFNEINETVERVPEIKIDRADVVILDPPRAGCDEKLLEAAVASGPECIVYVSCDPATLARDVKWLGEKGYEFKEATPCDMFPWSSHVETIVLLSKLDSKKYISVELPMDDMDLTSAESKATYKQIQNYVLEKFGFKVSTLYIAQVKKKHGLEVREHYNMSKNEKQKIPKCPIEKEEVILDALKNFKMIKDDF